MNEEDKLQVEELKPTDYQKHASFSAKHPAVSKSQMKGTVIYRLLEYQVVR